MVLLVCLSELPFDIAEAEILKYKDELLKQINRSYVMNSENDIITHPVIICVIRNCLNMNISKNVYHMSVKEMGDYILT